MAKRTVILTIDDNKEAEQFAREMVAAMGADPPLDNVSMPRVPAGATIQALLAQPSRGCTCQGGPEGWSRVPRFGWFICTECKKPNAIVVKNWISNHLNGCATLLEELFPGQGWAQPLWGLIGQKIKMLD